MAISAAMVKELRERTGAGMMECKKALVETGGDLEEAVLRLRKSGQAKADKKAARVAADGRVALATDGTAGVIVEINSETDFVAKDDSFVAFAEQVARRALETGADDVASLSAAALEGGRTVEEARTELVAKVGENIAVRRLKRLESPDRLGSYSHGGRIGVLVALAGGDDELARDLAMHIAASSPVCVDEAAVPADVLEKERAIFAEQARESGKPDDIVEKMVSGRVRKLLQEITLVGQPFVRDPDVSVGKLLESRAARVQAFVRFEVGEGIEKKQENFAEEVMAQVKGAR